MCTEEDLFKVTSEPVPEVSFTHMNIMPGSTSPSSEYIALGDYYSRKGFVTVIVDYRRVPEGKFPDGAEDLSLALQWLAKGEIKEADLNNVFMLGASAGYVSPL